MDHIITSMLINLQVRVNNEIVLILSILLCLVLIVLMISDQGYGVVDFNKVNEGGWIGCLLVIGCCNR